MSTVVTRENHSNVPEIGRFLAEYHEVARNVHAWHLYRLLPIGRGGARHGADLQIEMDDYRAICDQVKAMELPFHVFRRQDMYRSRTVDFFWCQDGDVICNSESAPDCAPPDLPTTR